MDVRVLRYFLAVAQEGSFSRAAESLFLSQPTLSRQIRELEEELGVDLFQRTNRNVQLTRDGMRLRRRAEEIVELMDKTRDEFETMRDEISGEIFIGSGETHLFRPIARVATELHREYPGIRYQIFSGNADAIAERLDRGLLDFGVVLEPAEIQKYESMRLPGQDRWGLLIPKDHPLAAKAFIEPDDLYGLPVMTSAQKHPMPILTTWLGYAPSETNYVAQHVLNIVAHYTLLYNAALMVEAGLGCAVCIDNLIDTRETSNLTFRPLKPELKVNLALVWKKYQIFSPAAELFLKRLKFDLVEPSSEGDKTTES